MPPSPSRARTATPNLKGSPSPPPARCASLPTEPPAEFMRSPAAQDDRPPGEQQLKQEHVARNEPSDNSAEDQEEPFPDEVEVGRATARAPSPSLGPALEPPPKPSPASDAARRESSTLPPITPSPEPEKPAPPRSDGRAWAEVIGSHGSLPSGLPLLQVRSVLSSRSPFDDFVPSQSNYDAVFDALRAAHSSIDLERPSAEEENTIDLLMRYIMENNQDYDVVQSVIRTELAREYPIGGEAHGGDRYEDFLDPKDDESDFERLCRTIQRAGIVRNTPARTKGERYLSEKKWKVATRDSKEKLQKARRILDMLKIIKGWMADGEKISLQWLIGQSLELQCRVLFGFMGVGPQAAMNALSRTLGRDVFAIGNNGLRLATWLGWVPEGASEFKAACHLTRTVPPAMQYALSRLFFLHPRVCADCATDKRGGKAKTEGKLLFQPGRCPLAPFVDRTRLWEDPPEEEAGVASPGADGPQEVNEGAVEAQQQRSGPRRTAERSVAESDDADDGEEESYTPRPTRSGRGRRRAPLKQPPPLGEMTLDSDMEDASQVEVEVEQVAAAPVAAPALTAAPVGAVAEDEAVEDSEDDDQLEYRDNLPDTPEVPDASHVSDTKPPLPSSPTLGSDQNSSASQSSSLHGVERENVKPEPVAEQRQQPQQPTADPFAAVNAVFNLLTPEQRQAWIEQQQRLSAGPCTPSRRKRAASNEGEEDVKPRMKRKRSEAVIDKEPIDLTLDSD